ncbi:MAG TPA: hypothetical protein PKY82_23600 [Pyrinomonadaceae bacterium]|nr:hypothetical protein [Pyrinomonadaceae bacterium]
MFRRLTEQEKKKFKQWARVNYIPQTEINPVWHPVIQAECDRINEEIEIQAGEYRNEIPAGKTLK